MSVPFRVAPGRLTQGQIVEANDNLREEMIGRVGRAFHIRRLDTSAIARETFIPEWQVCRYLETYRRRKREEGLWQ